MPRSRTNGYVVPAFAETNSAKATHFLHWCHQHRPGERISHKEIARVVYAVTNVRDNNVRGVKSLTSHIAKQLWKEHELGLDSNEDGMKAVSDVHEYVKGDYLKRTKKFAAGKRSIDFGNKIVESKRGEFKDNHEGRRLRQFVAKVRAASSGPALPDVASIRLLREAPESGDDE